MSPPDVPVEHLPAVVADAEADAVVTAGGIAEYEPREGEQRQKVARRSALRPLLEIDDIANDIQTTWQQLEMRRCNDCFA